MYGSYTITHHPLHSETQSLYTARSSKAWRKKVYTASTTGFTAWLSPMMKTNRCAALRPSHALATLKLVSLSYECAGSPLDQLAVDDGQKSAAELVIHAALHHEVHLALRLSSANRTGAFFDGQLTVATCFDREWSVPESELSESPKLAPGADLVEVRRRGKPCTDERMHMYGGARW